MPGWAQLSLENTATISWTYWASRLIINKNSKCFFLELPVSGVVSYAAVIINTYSSYYSQNFQFSSVQSLSRVRLFVTPWITARQASLSITNFWSSPRLTSIESVMPSSHLILYHPLLLLPPIPPSIRVFSNESTLHMRWPKYWSFSFSIIPSTDIPGLISFEWTGWISLQSKGLSRVFSNTTV